MAYQDPLKLDIMQRAEALGAAWLAGPDDPLLDRVASRACGCASPLWMALARLALSALTEADLSALIDERRDQLAAQAGRPADALDQVYTRHDAILDRMARAAWGDTKPGSTRIDCVKAFLAGMTLEEMSSFRLAPSSKDAVRGPTDTSKA